MLLKVKTYGYVNNEAENRVDCIPEEIAAVKYLHEKYFTYPASFSFDKRAGALVKIAKEKNFPIPPKGYWNKKAVIKILMDPIYSGVMH